MIPYTGSWSLMFAVFQTADAFFFLLLGLCLLCIAGGSALVIANLADAWRDMRLQGRREDYPLRAQCIARELRLRVELTTGKAA